MRLLRGLRADAPAGRPRSGAHRKNRIVGSGCLFGFGNHRLRCILGTAISRGSWQSIVETTRPSALNRKSLVVWFTESLSAVGIFRGSRENRHPHSRFHAMGQPSPGSFREKWLTYSGKKTAVSPSRSGKQALLPAHRASLKCRQGLLGRYPGSW